MKFGDFCLRHPTKRMLEKVLIFPETLGLATDCIFRAAAVFVVLVVLKSMKLEKKSEYMYTARAKSPNSLPRYSTNPKTCPSLEAIWGWSLQQRHMSTYVLLCRFVFPHVWCRNGFHHHHQHDQSPCWTVEYTKNTTSLTSHTLIQWLQFLWHNISPNKSSGSNPSLYYTSKHTYDGFLQQPYTNELHRDTIAHSAQRLVYNLWRNVLPHAIAIWAVTFEE